MKRVLIPMAIMLAAFAALVVAGILPPLQQLVTHADQALPLLMLANAPVAMSDVKRAIEESTERITELRQHYSNEIAFVREHVAEVERKLNRMGLGGGSDWQTSDDAERKALGTLVRNGDMQPLVDELQRKSGMRVSADTDGGYLQAPALSNQILTALRALSPMRRLARIETVGLNAGGEFIEPKELSEVGCAWVDESETRSETASPDLGATRVCLDEIYALVKVTQRMLDDPQFDVGAWVERAIADKFAREEGSAFITGNGIKKPTGILDYGTDAAGDATRSHTKWQHVVSGSAAAVTADGLRDLYWSLSAGYRSNATWLMSSAVASSVDKLKSTDNDYLWRAGAAAGEPPTLLGRPVEICEDMPSEAAGTTPIAFGDFRRGYLILERPGLRILRDPFTDKGRILLFVYRRTGGGAADLNAVKLLKCST